MGGDSCSEGRGFKYQYSILDGHFSHLFVVKIVTLFEKTKINEKEAGDGPFKKLSLETHLPGLIPAKAKSNEFDKMQNNYIQKREQKSKAKRYFFICPFPASFFSHAYFLQIYNR